MKPTRQKRSQEKRLQMIIQMLRHDVKQIQVAREIGVSKSTVSRHLAGKNFSARVDAYLRTRFGRRRIPA